MLNRFCLQLGMHKIFKQMRNKCLVGCISTSCIYIYIYMNMFEPNCLASAAKRSCSNSRRPADCMFNNMGITDTQLISWTRSNMDAMGSACSLGMVQINWCSNITRLLVVYPCRKPTRRENHGAKDGDKYELWALQYGHHNMQIRPMPEPCPRMWAHLKCLFCCCCLPTSIWPWPFFLYILDAASSSTVGDFWELAGLALRGVAGR